MPTVFISHSSKDNSFVEKLATDLRSTLGNHDSVWYDTSSLIGGDEWWREIRKQLKASPIFIIVLSPDAMSGMYVHREIDLALKQKKSLKNKVIVPVLYRDCEIRNDLKPFQHVSFLSQTYEEGLKDLLAAVIRNLLGRYSRRWLLAVVGVVVVGGGSGLLIRYLFPIIITQPTPTSPLPLPHIFYAHTGEVNAVAWSPDGKLIASGSRDNTAQVWDSSTGNTVFTYTGHDNWVMTLAWSPNGKYIASGGGYQAHVWDTSGKRLVAYTGHSGKVYGVTWSPDGKSVASASDDGTIQVWDALTGASLFTCKGHKDQVHAVAWSPDGKYIVSGSVDKTVQIWNASDGSHVYTYTGHSQEVDAVAWSPDSQHIVSGSLDMTAQVWNAGTGEQATIYKGHSDRVRSVAWSPDGKLIASGSADHTVQIWNPEGSNIITDHSHSNWVHAVAWSPDNKRIASASADDTVQVWPLK